MKTIILAITLCCLIGCGKSESTLSDNTNSLAITKTATPTSKRIDQIESELDQQEGLIREIEDQLIEAKRLSQHTLVSNRVAELNDAEATYKELYIELHDLVVKEELKINQK